MSTGSALRAALGRLPGRRKLAGTLLAAVRPNVVIAGWFRAVPNWGDALNPVLIRHLSGSRPIHHQAVMHDFRHRPVYSVIGSVLQAKTWPGNLEVWGSGFIRSDATFVTTPRRIHAVRGELSRDMALRQGVACPAVYGDPALLYPRFYRPAPERRSGIGIVPHYVDARHPLIERLRAMPGVRILDVTAGVREFVDQLCACEMIASSSLHGMIAADAYGVPSTRIHLSERVAGGGFKFHDYFSSVRRGGGEPLRITERTTLAEITDRYDDTPIDIDLDLLLEACPFATHRPRHDALRV